MIEPTAIDVLARELTCGICSNYLTLAVVLPTCNHMYCQGCINTLAKSSGGTMRIACPICNMHSVVYNLKPIPKITVLVEIVKKEKTNGANKGGINSNSNTNNSSNNNRSNNKCKTNNIINNSNNLTNNTRKIRTKTHKTNKIT